MEYGAVDNLNVKELLENAGWMNSLAKSLVEEPSSAEDLVQDTWTALLEHRPSRVTKGWFAKVLRNFALSRSRSETARRRREKLVSRPERVNISPEELAETAELQRKAVGFVLELDEPYRSLVLLRFFRELKPTEIARIQGIPVTTVRTRLEKALQFLRMRLDGVCGGDRGRWQAAFLPLFASPKPETLAETATSSNAALAGMPAAARVVAASALKASLLLGGIMKVYASIAAGLVIIAVCVYLIVKGGPGSVAPPAAPQARIVAKSELPSPLPPSKEKSPKDAAKEAAPGPAAAPEKREEPRASVAGRVLDDKDAPVPDADVAIFFHPPRVVGDRWLVTPLGADWFRRSRSLFTATDASGAFRFDGIPFSGNATVSALKEGFSGAKQPIEVAAGSTTEGVELKLPPGKTLRGVLLDAGGGPVTDAVVTLYHAWNPTGLVSEASEAGAGATNAEGRFEVGMGAKAEMCDLRVNSDSLGQDFFLEIPLTDEEVQLEMKPRAVLRGRITWEDGTPAKDVLVQLSARVPEDGRHLLEGPHRFELKTEAALDADGRYEVTGLQPGFPYNALVIWASGNRSHANFPPLTNPLAHIFTFFPGEEKTWDEAVALPIVVRGTMKTQVYGMPISNAGLGVRKDGLETRMHSGGTNAEGVFEIVLNTGPGRYLFFARPDSFYCDYSVDAIAERFGKTYDLYGGDEIEVDLLVFEPIVLPFRVIGSDGKPLELVIKYSLSFQTPNGRHFGCDKQAQLDTEGRTSLKLYTPVKEMTLYVSPLQPPLRTAERVFHPEPGTVLPEETFTIDRTCDVTGSLLDASGRPQAEQSFTFEATYDDKMKDSSTIATDKSGRFELKGQLRAKPMTLRIRGEHGGWKGEGLDASAGSLDLGWVVLDPARAEKR